MQKGDQSTAQAERPYRLNVMEYQALDTILAKQCPFLGVELKDTSMEVMRILLAGGPEAARAYVKENLTSQVDKLIAELRQAMAQEAAANVIIHHATLGAPKVEP